MRIFWTCASIDATRTMIATGEERTIDAEYHQKHTGGVMVFKGVEISVKVGGEGRF